MKRRLRSLLDSLAASCKDLALAAWRLYPTMLRPCAAPVAQLDRALPSEGRGREFESRRVRHIFNKLESIFAFCVPAVSRRRGLAGAIMCRGRRLRGENGGALPSGHNNFV